ncbi:MAG: vegetative cell wall protein [Verrucomicrobia bacterium]|nr:MAG: vegetative cell wall protein [Verrucomicrobiota bacterium]
MDRRRWIRVTGGVLALLVATSEMVAAPKSSTSHVAQGKTFPWISSFSPQSVNVGQAGFTLTVAGGNFAAGSVCIFNSNPRPTAVVNSSQLLVSILDSDLQQAGTFSIIVSNSNKKTASAPFVVSAAATDTTLASSVNPSAPGQAVEFVATVATMPPTTGTPTGNVIFFDGLKVLGTNVLNGGQASFTTAGLASGTHWIFAIYEGDGNCGASTNSDPFPQVVGQPSGAIGSVTSLSASLNSSVFGQLVVLTASVGSSVAGAGPPSGTVTFREGGISLATRMLSSGEATLAISSLAVGTHSITAVYNGDGYFASSASSSLSEAITQSGTTTTLSSSADPSVCGQWVTFTATITAVAPGGGTPSGPVTFYDGSSVVGSGTLSSGQATFTTSSLSVAAHSISAVYGGDGNFNASQVGPFGQTVNKASSTTSLVSSPNPSVFGQAVTLVASVSAVAPGSGTPTGTITFKDGSVSLLTVVLQSGQASLTTASLSRGSHSLTAVYSGDGHFYGGTSAVAGQTVN